VLTAGGVWCGVPDNVDHKLCVESTVKRDTKNPEWSRLEQLRFNTHMRDLLNTKLIIHVFDGDKIVGTAKIPFSSHYTTNEGSEVELKAAVVCDNGHKGCEFTASVYFKDIPRHAQMIGGEHTGKGTTGWLGGMPAFASLLC
jgi:hypothetical protein